MKKKMDAWSIVSTATWQRLQQGTSYLEVYEKHPEWLTHSMSAGANAFRHLMETRLPDFDGHYPHMLYYTPAYSSKDGIRIMRQTLNADVDATDGPSVLLRVRIPAYRMIFCSDYAFLRIHWDVFAAKSREELRQFDGFLIGSGLEDQSFEDLPSAIQDQIRLSWQQNIVADPDNIKLWPNAIFAFAENIYLTDVIYAQSVNPGSILYPLSDD